MNLDEAFETDAGCSSRKAPSFIQNLSAFQVLTLHSPVSDESCSPHRIVQIPLPPPLSLPLPSLSPSFSPPSPPPSLSLSLPLAVSCSPTVAFFSHSLTCSPTRFVFLSPSPTLSLCLFFYFKGFTDKVLVLSKHVQTEIQDKKKTVLKKNDK